MSISKQYDTYEANLNEKFDVNAQQIEDYYGGMLESQTTQYHAITQQLAAAQDQITQNALYQELAQLQNVMQQVNATRQHYLAENAVQKEAQKAKLKVMKEEYFTNSKATLDDNARAHERLVEMIKDRDQLLEQMTKVKQSQGMAELFIWAVCLMIFLFQVKRDVNNDSSNILHNHTI